jgi:cellulose synthase/poly-beta-1,6-N-acetylglucosamine synthase-like glycosyltransferase
VIELGLFGAFALAAIWGGYPFAVRALGGLRRKRDGDGQGVPPTVSVILASSDDAAAIRARVTDIVATSYPAELLEVVIGLDSVRGKATPRDLIDLPRCVFVVAGDPQGGKAASLNAAVRQARNELLVFTDTAQRFHHDAIPQLVLQFGNPRFAAVSGMLDLPGAGGSRNLAEHYWRYERWLRRWEARLHSSVGVTGAIYAMRRALWQPLPPGLILDDLFLPMRLVLDGWRVGFTEHAKALDIRRFAAGQEYRRKVRTLTGVIQVCAWLPGTLNPIRNPIWLQFVFHKLLRLLTPYLAALLVLSGAWFVISVVAARPFGMSVLVGLGAALVLLCLVPHVRRALRNQIAWGLAMQSSIVVATVNGVRGRWDVWQ